MFDAYAAMHAYLVRKGRKLSDNDVWIAACARATSATLITTDKDFDPLHGEFIQRFYFESKKAT
ncbi:PIN domain-containing protein [Sorangium sp. So ce1128]